MKEPNSLVKAATVVSSVLLLSGFVGYRAGAFHWLMGSDTPAAETANPVPAVGTLKPPPGAAQPAPTLMPGSKSMVGPDVILIPAASTSDVPVPVPPQPAPATPNQPPVLLPGSKASIIVPLPTTLPPPPSKGQNTPAPAPPTVPPPVQQKPVIIGGTKSAEVFRPSDVPQSSRPPQ